jgi:hydroxylamine reductase
MNCKCGNHCDCKVEKSAKKFDKNTTIGEVLAANRKNKVILEGFGMHCFGCPLSQMETLEEASQAHEIDLDFMLEKLNGKKQ